VFVSTSFSAPTPSLDASFLSLFPFPHFRSRHIRPSPFATTATSPQTLLQPSQNSHAVFAQRRHPHPRVLLLGGAKVCRRRRQHQPCKVWEPNPSMASQQQRHFLSASDLSSPFFPTNTGTLPSISLSLQRLTTIGTLTMATKPCLLTQGKRSLRD